MADNKKIAEFNKYAKVDTIRGISSKRQECLNRLDIFTCDDFIHMYPKSYQDRSEIKKICDIVPGEPVSFCGNIIDFTTTRHKNNLKLTVIKVSDGSGAINVVLFNRDYLVRYLRRGDKYYFYGICEYDYKGLAAKSPVMEKYSDSKIELKCRILPVYRLTAGITCNNLIYSMKSYLDSIKEFPEYIGTDILRKYNLCGYDYAIRNIHFPENTKAQNKARERLAFDELLSLQLLIRSVKYNLENSKNVGIFFPEDNFTDNFVKALPFSLSDSQLKVWNEIKNDMQSSKIMNRLVLGDVGSGKTVIAELAMLKAISAGYQAVFMAPTEILANQHFNNINKMFSSFGIKCVLLTGSLTVSNKAKVLESVRNGEAQCIIGTHALIQQNIVYHNVGIAITDEQHRFGVHQRASLASNGKNPDILIMSATPIPRTLALSLYGDMDVSYIDTLPKGRKAVKTYSADESMRDRVYSWAGRLANEGAQVYIVHPLITDEETDELTMQEYSKGLLSAEKNYSHASSKYFSNIKTGLIHGKMSAKEKEAVMNSFTSGETKILFSTTVIEVGVDISNASLIIIENAERFGLAQLHQLRGRVGRSSSQAYCVLMSDSKSNLAKERISVMCKTNSGFEIAEKDLLLRGPGDFFGTAQHGLPALKIANLYEDIDLLKTAREAAEYILTTQNEENKAFLENAISKIKYVY